jgi:6,7-dimethyl-8-ribityllumazine synthase
MQKVHEGNLSAGGRRFAIAVSRFNGLVTAKLLEGALDCLGRHGCADDDIEIAWVPGSFELPLAAQKLAGTGRFDVVICLGAIIRSATPHFDFVAAETAKGIHSVGLNSGIPVTFGVITTDNLEQALERAGTTAGNRGWDAALNAIEMANLVKVLS